MLHHSGGAGVAGLVVVLVLAGCVGAPTAPGSPTGTAAPDTPVETPPPGAESPDGTRTFPGEAPPEPFATVRLGNGSEDAPHTYTVWNHRDGERTIRITVTRDGETLHDERYTFPAEGALRLVLVEPGAYTVTVADGAAGTDRTITDGTFDCNRRGFEVAVVDGGAILVRRYQTEMACLTPTGTLGGV